MRSFGVISGLTLALVVGALILAPRLVSWDDYRSAVTRRAETLTGGAVAIDGRIDLALLPRPTLTLAGATLTRGGPPAAAMRLEVDRIDLQLAALPLLRGQLEVREMRLVRPTLRLDRAGALPGAGPLGALGSLLAWPRDGPSRLSVVDGRAMFDGATAATLEQINVELAARTSDGPFSLSGEFGYAALSFRLSGRLGRLAGDDLTTLQLELTGQPTGGQAVTLSFRGLTRWQGKAPQLRGRVICAGADLGAAMVVLEGTTGTALPRELGAAIPFSLSGELTVERSALTLDDLSLELATTEARGHLRVALQTPPAVDLVLEVPHLDLATTAVPSGWAALPRLLLALPATGQAQLSIGTLDYRGDTVRRIRARLALTAGTVVAIEEMRAVLPGQTDARFTGELAGDDGDPVLAGDLQIATGDLRHGLTWLGLMPDGIGSGRLRTFNLASGLQIDRDGLRLRDLDLRLDASRVTGSFAAQWGERRQIAAVLQLDRLDLDAYAPDFAPGDLPSLFHGALGEVDLALDARIGRLVWRDWRWQDIVLSGRSIGPQITIDELAVGEVAGAGLRLTGEVDLATETFALTAELATERPTSLIRRLGLDPPALLTRLAPLEVEAVAQGRLEAFDLDLSAGHDELRLHLAGTAGWSDRGADYDVRLEANHPDHRALLRGLGVRLASLDRDPAMPVDVGATVRAQAGGDTVVVGTARLGPSSLTGRIGWQSRGPRPRVSANLSAGEPRADLLGALLGLAGLHLQPQLIEGIRDGAWPDAPLALDWLGRNDGELTLSAKGGLAGAGLELSADWAEGRLFVHRLETDLLDGELQLEASLDADRPLPFMALALDLSAIDPRRLAAWLDLPPIVEGRADLYLEATMAGRSPRDMIRGMIGDLRIGLTDGRLIGIDRSLWQPAAAAGGDAADGTRPAATPPSVAIEELHGDVAIARGIATATDVEIALAGAKGTLEGRIDLLVWACDLRLDLVDPAGEPVSIHLVGPLDRPQVQVGRRSDEMAPLP